MTFSQNQLIAMATSFDKSEKGTDLSSALKTLSYGVKIVKMGPIYPEIFH